MDMVIAILALVISAFALVSNFTSNKYEREALRDQIYQRFAQMWFDMDQIFIDYPYMRKYFYQGGENYGYAVLKPEDKDFDRGLAIAERFCDVFQYSEPLEKYLKEDDLASYLDYKEMILAAPIVKLTQQRNDWHERD